jgi:hypothetical protein
MKSTARKSEPARMQLFLRISHPHIDPAEISRALLLEPEYSNKAGSSVSAGGVKKIHSESYWLAVLPVPSLKELFAWTAPARFFDAGETAARESVAPGKLPARYLSQVAGFYDMQVILSLKKLDGHKSFIKRIINEGGTITIVLQRADRAAPLTIGPDLAKRLADLEIRLEID